MTNLEKHKDDLLKYVDTHEGNLQDLITDFMDGQNVDFSNYCGTDNMIALWWLLEKCEDPIEKLEKLSIKIEELGGWAYDLTFQPLQEVDRELKELSNGIVGASEELDELIGELRDDQRRATTR
jgi:hypothetical protein